MMQSHGYPPLNRAVTETGCYITSVGVLEHGPGSRYPPPGHPSDYRFEWGRGRIVSDVILLLISRGRGTWETRHGSGVLVPGSVLFLPSLEWHRYRPDPETGWVEKWLCLRGATVHRLIDRKVLPSRSEVLKCDKTGDFEGHLDRLRQDILGEEGKNLPSWGARALALLLAEWERQTRGHQLQSVTKAIADQGNFARRALGFIEANCHRPILVGDVARACGCTRRTVERSFRNAGWGSVSAKITTERMTLAKDLLRETELSVKQVAGDAGFQSSQHMIACFRRLEECTPSAYRQSGTPTIRDQRRDPAEGGPR